MAVPKPGMRKTREYQVYSKEGHTFILCCAKWDAFGVKRVKHLHMAGGRGLSCGVGWGGGGVSKRLPEAVGLD